MDEKWLDGESWLQPGASAYSNAPAGGIGPGYCVPSLSRLLGCPHLSIPGFHAPQACFYDWTGGTNANVAGDLKPFASEIKRNMEQYSFSIRDAVPHQELRAYFDQQDKRAALACESGERDEFAAFRKLRIEANWFEDPSAPSILLQDTNRALSRAQTFTESASAEGARSAFTDMAQAAVLLRDRTIANIKKAWDSAGRLGKQAELIETWRRRMRWIDDVSSPGGAEKDSSPAGSNADPDGTKSKSPPKEKTKKTWVEFQLVDMDGKPVPNQKYVVTLPSGSRETGVLDEHGMVRFDGIDPGQCEFSLPEIDGREWRPFSG